MRSGHCITLHTDTFLYVYFVSFPESEYETWSTAWDKFPLLFPVRLNVVFHRFFLFSLSLYVLWSPPSFTSSIPPLPSPPSPSPRLHSPPPHFSPLPLLTRCSDVLAAWTPLLLLLVLLLLLLFFLFFSVQRRCRGLCRSLWGNDGAEERLCRRWRVEWTLDVKVRVRRANKAKEIQVALSVWDALLGKWCCFLCNQLQIMDFRCWCKKELFKEARNEPGFTHFSRFIIDTVLKWNIKLTLMPMEDRIQKIILAPERP